MIAYAPDFDEPDTAYPPDDSELLTALVYEVLPKLSRLLSRTAHDLLVPRDVKADPAALLIVKNQLLGALADYLTTTTSADDLRPSAARNHYPQDTLLRRIAWRQYEPDLAKGVRLEIERLRYADFATLSDDDLLWTYHMGLAFYRAALKLYAAGRIGRAPVRQGEKLVAKAVQHLELRGLRLP